VVISHIGPKPLAVTSNINLSFLRRPKVQPLVAEASLLKLGRSLAFAEVSVFNEGDPKPVAHAVVTYALTLADLGIDPSFTARTS
jgi:acyl-coenzyme A thioesterase PaaI-like protein